LDELFDLQRLTCTFNQSIIRRSLNPRRHSKDHPLRQCAKRLQAKSEKLLKNITDRKERTDPVIPGDLPGRSPSAVTIKQNGINGHVRSHSSTPTPTPLAKSVIRIPPIAIQRKRSSTETIFPDMPALIRTADGMSTFKLLNEDMEIDESNVEDRLRSYTLEELEDHQVEAESEDEYVMIGEKRKPCVLRC
jgi:transcriptional activator SPT7